MGSLKSTVIWTDAISAVILSASFRVIGMKHSSRVVPTPQIHLSLTTLSTRKYDLRVGEQY